MFRPALSLVNNLRSVLKLTVTSLRSSAVSFDLHYLYHPIGIKWGVTTANPTRTQLETASNWSLVYETKNVGIVRATVVSNHD